jgi:hypothetical protein
MLLDHPKLESADLSSLQCFWYGAAPISVARLTRRWKRSARWHSSWLQLLIPHIAQVRCGSHQGHSRKSFFAAATLRPSKQ